MREKLSRLVCIVVFSSPKTQTLGEPSSGAGRRAWRLESTLTPRCCSHGLAPARHCCFCQPLTLLPHGFTPDPQHQASLWSLVLGDLGPGMWTGSISMERLEDMTQAQWVENFELSACRWGSKATTKRTPAPFFPERGRVARVLSMRTWESRAGACWLTVVFKASLVLL